jgi:hypothetical protein
VCFARRKRKAAYRILVEKPDRKKPLRKPRLRFEDKLDGRACTGFICFRTGTSVGLL